jgi:hypothetical protein
MLEIAQRIHEKASRPFLFVLDDFYGFLDADGESEEMILLDRLRGSSLRVVSETGFEINPGRCGRVFASDIFEYSFVREATEAHVMKFEFSGGCETLSMRIANSTEDTSCITCVTIASMPAVFVISTACLIKCSSIKSSKNVS